MKQLNKMNNISECPICSNVEFSSFLEVKDHMITQEIFNIVSCNKCGFHFTNPIPELDSIGHYYKGEAYVSHSSSKKGFINWLYNVVRRRTLKQKVSWLRSNSEGNRLLDLGCGTGHFLRAAIDAGYQGVGIEPDQDARKFAQSENNITPLPQSELYRLEKGSIDVVSMWHVLEHVYDLQKDVEVLSQLLSDKGTFFIAVPNMNSFDAQKYNSSWAAYDVPRHLYHFKETDIINLFGRFGFELTKVVPMKFDAYYVSMLSEKYIGGSMLKAITSGWTSNRKAKKYGFSSQVYVLKRK